MYHVMCPCDTIERVDEKSASYETLIMHGLITWEWGVPPIAASRRRPCGLDRRVRECYCGMSCPRSANKEASRKISHSLLTWTLVYRVSEIRVGDQAAPDGWWIPKMDEYNHNVPQGSGGDLMGSEASRPSSRTVSRL
jgi:hypothetical protein